MKTNISNIVIGNIKKFLKPIIEETDKRRKKILPKIVLGIILSKSTVLAEIGRKIKKKVQTMKTIENILSRHLNSDAWEEEKLMGKYEEWSCSKIAEDSLVIIDPSERVKPYGGGKWKR